MLWYVSGLLRKRLNRQWQCTRTELPRDWPQLSTSCQTPHRAGLAIPVAGRGGDSNRSPPVVAPSRRGRRHDPGHGAVLRRARTHRYRRSGSGRITPSRLHEFSSAGHSCGACEPSGAVRPAARRNHRVLGGRVQCWDASQRAETLAFLAPNQWPRAAGRFGVISHPLDASRSVRPAESRTGDTVSRWAWL